MSPKILLLTLPLLLAGCSSLSEEECRAMSWYNQGYQDGEQGKTRSATRDYQKTCGEYGLKVDEAEWQRGYAKGLEDDDAEIHGFRFLPKPFTREALAQALRDTLG